MASSCYSPSLSQKQRPLINHHSWKWNPTNEKSQKKISERTTKYIEDRQRKRITGAIGTKLRRKEFALRKEEMKLMNDGCCSSLHVFLIIQTPPLPALHQTMLPPFNHYNKSQSHPTGFVNCQLKLLKFQFERLICTPRFLSLLLKQSFFIVMINLIMKNKTVIYK